MSEIDLAACMTALAAAVEGVTPRVYDWPTESITVPCIVVGYPEEIPYDFTYGRSSDSAVFPVLYIVGRVSDRHSKQLLSNVISGDDSIKNLLEGDLGNAIQSSRVTRCRINEVKFGDVSYLAAIFDTQIIT